MRLGSGSRGTSFAPLLGLGVFNIPMPPPGKETQTQERRVGREETETNQLDNTDEMRHWAHLVKKG